MKALILFVALLVPSLVRADTIDRIQACRASGQTACIFDLLIEMDAKIRNGHGGHDRLLEPGVYRKVSGGCCENFEVGSHSYDRLSLTLCSTTVNLTCRNGASCTGEQNMRVEVTGRDAFRFINSSNNCEFVKR